MGEISFIKKFCKNHTKQLTQYFLLEYMTTNFGEKKPHLH